MGAYRDISGVVSLSQWFCTGLVQLPQLIPFVGLNMGFIGFAGITLEIYFQTPQLNAIQRTRWRIC